MPNVSIIDHPVVGTTHTFRADQPPHVEPAERKHSDGILLVGNGMTVTVLSAFRDWNGVPGLDMLYVRCHETGQSTHVTPADLGMAAL